MKKVLSLLVVLTPSLIIFAEEYYESSDQELREGLAAKQQARRVGGPFRTRKAQCYCSDLCGPRDVKPDDAPFYDPTTGKCFCQERDKRNYLPNQCDKKPQVEFESVCDKKNERSRYTRGVYQR